ncbi:MAG: hypothetical protein SCI25_07195 [Desulfuromonadales bacterium]|nr:hypothetical protein [Desulfuromonadales bacterium]MDW7756158.1 hypothetical protein [Desulfuromonadales bacterium]
MYPIKSIVYWLVVVFGVCFSLSGCAGLIHTETTRIKVEGLIVTDREHLTEWSEFFSSPDSRVKIISEEDSLVQASDLEVENKFYHVSYLPYYQGFCEDFRNEGLVEKVQREFKKKNEGIIVESASVDEKTLQNCKDGLQSSVIWSTNNDSHVAELPLTIYMTLDSLVESKYKYEWAGTRCADGWISSSTGRGACSWHGGVAGSVYRKRYLVDKNSPLFP